MKKTKAIVLTGLLSLLVLGAHSQQPYWQQQLRYSIDVTLNDRVHALDGFLNLEYNNLSSDTLHHIWFHVWPNAYKNDRTAFSDQVLEHGSTRFYFSDDDARGYINQLNFSVDGVTADIEDHPSHIDIIKLVLPQPLLPGNKINIATKFHVQLPALFSRSGHQGQHYQIAQWYPKPAVYDRDGWHEMPYLDQGEYYAEFADYDVRITIPENYVVAASGYLQDQKEKEWLLGRSDFEWTPKEVKVKTKGGAIKKVKEEAPESSAQTKTLRYTLSNAHDFAWFADKRFRVRQDIAELPSGKKVPVYAFYLPEQEKLWSKVPGFAKRALETRSKWIGDYPFDQFSVVQSIEPGDGGMEYPTITLISPSNNEVLLHYVVAHEAGHNWFQGALGSNERATPWLDEGLNTYYDNRYAQEISQGNGEISFMNEPISLQSAVELIVEQSIAVHRDQPIHLSSEKYTVPNYSFVVYGKTALWLQGIVNDIGQEAFDKGMQQYYQSWKYRHPNWQDFKKIMEDAAGKSLDQHFALIHKTGPLPGQERKGFRMAFPFSKKNIRETLTGKAAHTLLVSPVIGYNAYDKFMIGGLFTNLTIPTPKFQYLFTPMYGTGSRDIAGHAMLNYSFYPENKNFRKIDLGLGAAKFDIYEFTAPNGDDLQFGMTKLAPRIRFTQREKSARSTRERYLQFKSYFISEEGLRFSRDSVFQGGDTLIVDSYGTRAESRVVNQVTYVWQDHRELYPYRAELKLEQGKDFMRAAFTGKYFFNYAKGGGLEARFFAGKFFYLGDKTFSMQFETDRYHLNMTGANGAEDYTYSDYFIGRNEFEGFASQQIMERDGGFKTRTDMLASKVGRTDDWLIALNLTTSIPDKLNPLRILPFRIPLKLFADIGTYSEAWDRNANLDRFLFDAGLQVSLLKETVQVYLPLVYSQPFKEYIQSTIPKKERLTKKISFSISFSNLQMKKIQRVVEF